MFFYLAGNEVKPDDGFTMTMMYNRNFILEIWFPMLVFDIIAVVFLSIDYSSCPADPLWIWSLMAVVAQIVFFYCIALCATINYSYEKFRLHANVAAFAITGTVAITGAIVLFLPKLSCVALLYSGLWIWAIFAFTIVGIAFIYYGIITYLGNLTQLLTISKPTNINNPNHISFYIIQSMKKYVLDEENDRNRQIIYYIV